VEGGVRFKGESILDKTEEELRKIRGGHISIVVQDALAALSPVLTVGEQVADVLLAHSKTNRRAAWQRTLDMFRRVQIPDPAARIKAFPHEFSGGMQQRAVIASALICCPDLIIADEPTTALDVTIQLQVLTLLREARDELGCAVLYISHDLAAVAQISDRVLIMYGGEIVESAPTVALFSEPEHPYTQALLASIPKLAKDPPRYLSAIPGMPPDPAVAVPGCKFADRCRSAAGICRREHPELIQTSADRQTRCFLYSRPNSMGPQAAMGTPGEEAAFPLRHGK
jgi:oligopeptide/dipeptide ABC transporter ATP-binding protein